MQRKQKDLEGRFPSSARDKKSPRHRCAGLKVSLQVHGAATIPEW